MDKALLYTLGAEQYAMFMDNFKMSMRKGESEYIHHLRVAMKRLVAIIEYLKVNCDAHAKYLKVNCDAHARIDVDQIDESARFVYKAAGKVRNLQVALISISDHMTYEPPGDFMEFILRKLQKRKKNYFQIAKDSKLLSNDSFSNTFSEITDQYYIGDENSIWQHLERNKKLAVEFITNSLPGKDWHEARRWLKRNYLLMQMFEHSLSNELHFGQLVYYRHIEQILGQWHDLLYLKKLTVKYEVKFGLNTAEWSDFKNEIADSMIKLEKGIRQSL